MQEKLQLYIKNMVCSRCEIVLEATLKALGLEVKKIELGYAEVIRTGKKPSLQDIKNELERFNFGLIETPESKLSEQVKHILLNLLEKESLEDVVLSEYLARSLSKSYATISRTFSAHEGITIEKFFIQLKIEKAKQLTLNNELSFSEIAYKLGYKNQQHLSRQFKEITGMSMSEYQKLNSPNQQGLEGIW